MIVLSGDVGGTSTRMQFTEFKNGAMQVLKTTHYSNNNYASFTDIIDAFFIDHAFDKKDVQSACFGVAGPIINGVVKLTNLPWVLRESDIKTRLSIEKVELINDFSAIGYGLETLVEKDLYVLQAAKPRENGIRTFIGAGTGIGVGFMSFFNGSYVVHPTEGGHVDFAPTDDVQMELLHYLRKKYHRVSLERLLSGQGLVRIYHFVRDHKIFGEEENPALRFLIESDQDIDIAATVAEYAIKHKDIMALRALDIFIRIYGSAVGNIGLTTLPFGGLYIVGGIAPKLVNQIVKGPFMEMYHDKGRVAGLLKDIPVYIVMNTDVGLQGAAVYARRIADGK